MDMATSKILIEGGSGSGNFGHAGIPGHQGGSAPSDEIVNEYPTLSKTLGDSLQVFGGLGVVQKRHLDDLDKLPSGTIRFLKDRGWKFLISDEKITDINGMSVWKGVHPPGWPEGSTYDSLAGACLTSETSVILTQGEGFSDSLALHEASHAIDLAYDEKGMRFGYSQRMEFKDAYTKSYEDKKSRTHSPYFDKSKRGSWGLKETFAEASATYLTFGYEKCGSVWGEPLALYMDSLYSVELA